jgi:8-oxo-dGTP pyrophosphatase MutT (NUDIX family)
MSFKDSYLGKLRQIIGSAPVLIPGARLIVLNQNHELLFIKRTDFKTWGFIGGSSEFGENIITTATREAKEEAGIDVVNLKLWGVSTSLEDEHVKYPNGDEIHAHSMMFYTYDWNGEICADQVESSEVKFFSMDALPNEMHPNTKKALNKFLEFYKTKELSIT